VCWYLSYIISSYKHWNMECVWDNHPFILHLLVVFYILVYWLILDVLILVVFHTLVYWLILDVLILAVLNLGVASGQYSCPRLNTTVHGHNTGLISKHSFHDTFLKVSWNGCFDIYPTLFPRTNIEMWNVSETTTPSYCIYWLYFTY
jgi:hypothetical protein